MQYWKPLLLSLVLAAMGPVYAETKLAVYLYQDGTSPQVAWVLPSAITATSNQGEYWRKIIWQQAHTGYIKVIATGNDQDGGAGAMPQLPLPPLKLKPLVTLLKR